MHQYGAKDRDQCYSILPRKLGGGGGGFGMGVAPHCGYDDGGVLGMATPYLPPAVDSISTKNLIYMRRTRPVEFAYHMDPNPYSTHKAVMQSAVDYATYRKASNPHVQAGTGRKPSESSGFVYSEGSKVDWSTYGRQVEPETIEPQRLKAMKKSNPAEFWDIIRASKEKTSLDTQTTTKNFQKLGTYRGDDKFFYVTPSAITLM